MSLVPQLAPAGLAVAVLVVLRHHPPQAWQEPQVLVVVQVEVLERYQLDLAVLAALAL
jgi:hypothetical protein